MSSKKVRSHEKISNPAGKDTNTVYIFEEKRDYIKHGIEDYTVVFGRKEDAEQHLAKTLEDYSKNGPFGFRGEKFHIDENDLKRAGIREKRLSEKHIRKLAETTHDDRITLCPEEAEVNDRPCIHMQIRAEEVY